MGELIGEKPDTRSLFALWLHRRRQSLGLTPGAFAERMGTGCDPETVQAWEAGTLRPSNLMAERVARLFGVPGSERSAFILFAISDLDSDPTGEYVRGPAEAGVDADPHLDPDAPWRVNTQPPSNLPAQLTTFVGREGEIEGAAGLVRFPGVRLLTLLGPPGIGKTRFSLEVARYLLDAGSFEDGVFFVPLAAVTDPAGIAPTIGAALGVKEVAGDAAGRALTDFLHDKHLLLVLDNMEQIAAAGDTVSEMLTASPGVQIVTTSRSALHVYGEQVWRVPPLSIPDSPDSDGNASAESLVESAAASLFLQRAKAVNTGFVVDSESAPVIARICRRLDGLPLAIELAAARTNVLSPQALLARLDSRLDILTSGPQNLTPRHRTLRGAIEWSYNLLEDDEKIVYSRLSVFVSGFTLEAAEAIACCGSARHSISNTLDLIASLVDKSLLKQEEGPDKEARFTMLETIREYGQERLGEWGEEDEVRATHSKEMLAFAEQAEPHMTTGGRDPWLRKLDAELDNIRAALNWSLSDEGDGEIGLRLASSLHWYWSFRGYVTEGRRWLRQILHRFDTSAETEALAKALYAEGQLAQHYGDDASAYPSLTRSVAMCKALGNSSTLAYAMVPLSIIGVHRSDPDLICMAEEAVALFRQSGDLWGLAYALDERGDIADMLGDFDEALALKIESHSLYREIGDTWHVAYELGMLGLITMQQGNYAQSNKYLREASVITREVGDKWTLAWLLRGQGNNAHLEGRYAEAEALYLESASLYRELGDQGRFANVYRNLGQVATLQGRYTEATSRLREAIAIHNSAGLRASLHLHVSAFAAVAVEQGQFDIAAKLFAAAIPPETVNLVSMSPVDLTHYTKYYEKARRKLGKADFEALTAQGQQMTLAEAISLAQKLDVLSTYEPNTAKISQPTDSRSFPDALTKREVELLRLVAVGLSNAEIADRLFLSSNTVRAHLYSIYAKINVASRTAAAHYATENGLL
ncbi:MAG: LuxR C-terminal-related transcriptional regulator [Chloroflexota bacterium]